MRVIDGSPGTRAFTTQRPSVQRLAWKPVGAVAATAAVALLLTINRYDYHRDELYFRMLGDHPKWGYVDQPPFTPLLIRLCAGVFGDTLWAIRLPGVLEIVAAAFLLAYIAREAGGGTVAQTLAASGVLTTFVLVATHITLTAGPDLLVWLLVILCAMRALLRGQERHWLLAGLFTGLGLYNKHLVILLLLMFSAGLLVLGPRKVLRSPWLWAGLGAAVVVGLPNLIYQVVNDYPQLDMAAALRDNKGDEARITLIPLQLAWLGPLFVRVWVAGIVTLFRDPVLRPIRAFGLAYPLMLVALFAVAGQPYYSVGLLAALFAIGTVPVERRITRRWVIVAGAAVNAAFAILTSLPVLPVGVVGGTPIPATNQGIADQVGWRRYVRQVADVYEALPASDKPHTVLLTGNYGEAGALDRYGRALGLPRVYSGQNELWWLGPPPASATVVVLVTEGDPGRSGAFGSCELKAELDNGYGVENEEQSARVFVCRDLTGTWAGLWPSFQHFD